MQDQDFDPHLPLQTHIFVPISAVHLDQDMFSYLILCSIRTSSHKKSTNNSLLDFCAVFNAELKSEVH